MLVGVEPNSGGQTTHWNGKMPSPDFLKSMHYSCEMVRKGFDQIDLGIRKKSG
jgi:hypothetical protein